VTSPEAVIVRPFETTPPEDNPVDTVTGLPVRPRPSTLYEAMPESSDGVKLSVIVPFVIRATNVSVSTNVGVTVVISGPTVS